MATVATGRTSMGAVCLVVVTFNRLSTLQKSLQAIAELAYQPARIIVVDNGSTDGTADWLIRQSPEIEFVPLGSNLGYAAGLAAGIRHAIQHFEPVDFFWLMDDDSRPSRDALTSLLEIKKELSLPGILSLTGFVDTVWNGPIPISRYPKRDQFKIESLYQLYHVEHALIDGALIDREVVEAVGVPDGRFFMMCEDVEYCKRVIRAGYRVIVWDSEENMTRLHQGGGGRFSKSNLWRGYYGARNHLLILKTYFSVPRAFGYVIRQAKYLVAACAAPDRSLRIRLRLLGIWHGLMGIRGKTIDPSRFA